MTTQATTNQVAISDPAYHPKIHGENCWQLEAKAVASPVSWMSVKNRPQCSTWRHAEHKVTEQWQQGKVKIHKITSTSPYLVVTGFDAPPDKIQHAHNTYFRLTSKADNNLPSHLLAKLRWLEPCKIKAALLNSSASSHIYQVTDKL